MSEQQDNKPMNPISVMFEADTRRSAAYKDRELIGECEFYQTDNVQEQDDPINGDLPHLGHKTAFSGGGAGLSRNL